MKIKKFIKIYKIKHQIKTINKSNHNHIDYSDSKILNSHCSFKISGENNRISLGDNCLLNICIEIYGDNNTVIIGKNNSFNANCQFYIGTPDAPTSNCTIIIGNDSNYNGCTLRLCEPQSSIEIGERCLFSGGINIWASDSHSILQDSKLINIGKSVIIGNHVWVGMDCKIGKNTQISDNSIIGWGSVVTRKFNQSNIIIAGNPAAIIKENIDWDSNRPIFYLNNK